MNEKQLEDEPVPVSCKTYHDPPPKYPHFYSFRLDQTENLKLGRGCSIKFNSKSSALEYVNPVK